MPLNDGVTLACDLYQPEGDGPYPGLLMRQPYGRSIASTVVYGQPEYFARQGFLVVIQDVRGRGDSEGDFYAFRNEANDGIETINWVAGLPQCDGRVCMYGFSYQAYTQLAVLANRPAALVAIAPHMTAADLYNGWFYKNGILRLATTLSWGNQMLREDDRRVGAEGSAEALERSWRQPGALTPQLPIAGIDPLCRSDLPTYAADWLAHDQPDDFWASLDTTEALSRSELPVFHLAGYYDYYLEGSLSAYGARREPSNDLLLLGPWKHIPWERHLCGLDLGSEARIDTDRLLVEWLQSHLGLRPNPPPRGVRYFLMGANQWKEAATWPPPAEPVTWFLHSAGHANSLFGDGELRKVAEDSPADTFVYDPEVPVHAPGGPSPAWGPVDLRDQQQGNNLLVFETPTFEATFTFAGHPKLTLFVDADVPSTDIVARLSWVREDHRAHFLSLAAATIKPGNSPLPLHLTFDACALRIAPGELLRLDIAGSAFPLLARNPNTGKPRTSVANPGEFAKARITVYHHGALASSLNLPALRAA